MGKITRFEDLICWQKARELVNRIYSITKTGSLSQDYGLRDQLRRAAVSSMTNIAEGFARYHRKEFIRFLDISQSSASEVKSLLYVVLDQNYLYKDTVSSIQNKAGEVQVLTLGLLKYVNNSISTNKVSEPFVKYGHSQKSIEIPDEFINHEYSNT